MKRDKPEKSSLHPSSLIPHPSSFNPSLIPHPSGPPPPSKKLGQNFLVNEGVVRNIVDALAPERNETVIEIGPGRGALTAQLLSRAERVVAVEFDRNLIPHLTERFRGNNNFKLVPADALTVDFCTEIQPADTARVVANLPYNVATAILQRLIVQRRCLNEMVLMLQREVVARIIAPPGTNERGYLSVFVQYYCQTEKLFDVAPGSFRPAPKVWSSVVRLVLRSRPAVSVKDENLLWRVVSVGFAQRRKTILNNMRSGPPDFEELMKRHGGASIVLCRADVDLQRRAETLTLEEWARIVEALE